jgi:hypothetical protein
LVTTGPFIYTVQMRGRSAEGIVSLLAPEETQGRGGLPPQAIIGALPGGASDITTEGFVANRAFRDLLHSTIERHGPQSPGLQAAAREQGEGWVYLIDRRSPDPEGDVPLEDIVGSFKVEGGAVVSYKRNSKHRLVSARGLFQLDAWLHERLMEELRNLPRPPDLSAEAGQCC